MTLRKEKKERIKNPNKELIKAANEDEGTRYHLVALLRYHPQALKQHVIDKNRICLPCI